MVPTGLGARYAVGANTAGTGWLSIEVAARPTVTGVSPRLGPVGGGRTVTITGTGLTDATSVRFGTTTATHVQRVSSTTLTARTPAHSAGRVDVRVTSPAGTSPSVKADGYTYLKVPALTSLSPKSGPTGGGTTVTILGFRFTSVSKVLFGASRGTHVAVTSSTKITVRAPAHGKGTVDVRVTTPGGTSARVQADRYTYR